MRVWASQSRFFLLCLAVCVCGIWWQDRKLYEVAETSISSTCTQEIGEGNQHHPHCILEEIDRLPFSTLTSALESIAPPEFLQKDFSADRVSLSLFPHIEYAVVRRCVFSQIQHPYCVQKNREEVHLFIQKQLSLMLQSSNEEIQYRAMLLACARNRVGRSLSVVAETEKIQAMSLYVSLCEDDPKKKHSMIRDALGQKDSSETILLLSLLTESGIDVAAFSKQLQKQSPLSKSLYDAIYSTVQE